MTKILLRSLIASVFLCAVNRSQSLRPQPVFSRPVFLRAKANALLSLFLPTKAQPVNDKLRHVNTLELPLTFLPRGGCLAVRMYINNRQGDTRVFSYSAIIDTGSPFVTAPSAIQSYSRDESGRYPPTQEQYGATSGGMQWRSIDSVEFRTTDLDEPFQEITKMVVGIPDDNVVDDTGGIFLGLIAQDDYRPTLLQQLGYSSFTLDYPNKILKFYRTGVIAEEDPDAMELFDFAPYGKDLYHYGIVSPFVRLFLDGRKGPTTISSFKRPVIAVIDTGLTGCVFSDSLHLELLSRGYYESLDQVNGLQVSLETTTGQIQTLSSNPNYWFLTDIKLPWFDDDDKHPHVIAMGATFLSDSRLSIDPFSRKAKIQIA